MPDMDEAIAARMDEALRPIHDELATLNATITELGQSMEKMAVAVSLMAQTLAEGVDDVEPEPPVLPNPPVIGTPGLKEMVVPEGYRQRDLRYNNQLEELLIDSGHGLSIGDPAHPLALNDNWRVWGGNHNGIVTLDHNSDKCIKAHIEGITHELTPNGMVLRTHKYLDDMQMTQWIKDSYGQNHNATVGGAFSTEGRQSCKVGVWQAMVRKNKIAIGDHSALWTLADTDPSPWPPEEDLFEQVPGDPMGNGLSTNVFEVPNGFVRHSDLTLDDWTLCEVEFTGDEQVLMRFNGEERHRSKNPFPDLARYFMFTFESNGNWPTDVGSATSYETFGSEYEFAYIRLFTKEG